jgi:hypothetical protein
MTLPLHLRIRQVFSLADWPYIHGFRRGPEMEGREGLHFGWMRALSLNLPPYTPSGSLDRADVVNTKRHQGVGFILSRAKFSYGLLRILVYNSCPTVRGFLL